MDLVDLSDVIKRLYANVLQNDIRLHKIPENKIRFGVYSMAIAYSPEHDNLNPDSRVFPDYNDPAFRAAYLHKYAAFHTYIVLNVMRRILQEKKNLFQGILNGNGQLQMCCLGGGPGSEVVGVLLALHLVFNSFKIDVIDCMEHWDSTFESVIEELKFGEYGDVFSTENIQWNYLGANLLEKMNNDTNKSIAQASLLTMVKFLSSVSWTSAESMLKKIFRVLKPGALVLYIDNAAGGFTEAIERAAEENHLRRVFVRRHVLYEDESFKLERFQSTSCYKTKVAVLLLQKQQEKRLQQTSASIMHPLNRPFTQIPITNHSRLRNQLRDNLDYESFAYVTKVDNLNFPKFDLQNPYREVKMAQSVENLNNQSGWVDNNPGVFRKHPTQPDFSVFRNSYLGFSGPSEIFWRFFFPDIFRFFGDFFASNFLIFIRDYI